MTTILADLKLGVMVSDSCVSDGDRTWSDRKVFRHEGVLYGFAGHVDERLSFMDWIKGGPVPSFGHSTCLMMSAAGLFVYETNTRLQKVDRGIEAIGSGGKAAICAYEALGFIDPVKAVRIVCKHDAGSLGPVRMYKFRS